ncbi:galectin-8-like [Macrosteles quadrilineatus]|uniref:galectin-8-like n=1 Tax=Macrosteles quadrilineatus TaxID=74068 RepID=UPI0023E1F162|nr:galectin-8-like [Macrosteles quadrilineatus]
MTYAVERTKPTSTSDIELKLVGDEPDWFRVLFLVGAKELSPNYGFIFSAWFNGNLISNKSNSYIGLNTEVKDQTLMEEVAVDEKFSFRRGHPFYLEFYITEAKFMVAVDGHHYASYKHRVPLKSINKVKIVGDITLTNVHF